MSDAGRVVKDQKGKHAADEFKNVLKALADAFRRLATEYLAEALIAVRE